MKNNKGITLIALVVTIVVLLILAGVSIGMLAGENGIIRQAQSARENTRGASAKEEIDLWKSNVKMDGLTNSETAEEVDDVLNRLVENGTLKQEEADKLKNGETIKIGDTEISLDGTTGGGSGNGNDEQVAADSLGIVPEINKEEMTPVKYEDGEWKEVEDLSKPGEWFAYSEKQWANVETENGYFVYIPRYAYKITSGYHQSLTNAGTMAVVFLNEDNTLKTTTDSEGNTVSASDLIHANEVNSAEEGVGLNATTKYIIHPAFEAFDTADKKVDGLWVAKYEMSMEGTTDGGTTWNNIETSNSSIGDVSIKTDTTKRMVSKPGVSSWRSIQVTNIFDNCYNMNRTLDSHMMKNTEWGAVAYLTVSKYGKGATSEVEQNKSGSYMTGYGSDSTLSTGAASTTGNMYGIFDMSGGAYEYVAGYLEDECMVKDTGSRYSYNANLVEAESKYKDVYSTGTTNSFTDSYTANNSKVGDGLWEVISNTGSTYGWYGDYCIFVGLDDSAHYPVFSRGGHYRDSNSDAGVFCAYSGHGSGHGNNSFRVVCVVE